MRLTKEMKKDLTQALVRKVFQEQFDDIVRSVKQRLDFIATTHFKADHERALALGKENEDLLLSVRARFTLTEGNVKVEGFPLLFKDFLVVDRRWCVKSSEHFFFISNNQRCRHELPPTKSDLVLFEDAQAQLDMLKCKYDEFVTNLNSVLASVSTEKALLELLPEAKKYLPDEPRKMPLPVEKADLIRGLL